MIRDLGRSRARDVEDSSGVRGLHIVENVELERMLFDRNLVGLPYRRACFEASRLFLAHLRDEFARFGAAELVILSKGIAYQLAAAAETLDINLPANLVATSRVNVLSDDAKVDISYSRFDAGGSTLVIGDTVASGATVVTAVEAYRKVHDLERVFLLSYAGSTTGAHRVAEYCDSSGVDCTILYGLASFGLGVNGFDLSFNHEETITRSEYRSRAMELYSGKQVSAVGWDFGSQFMAPEKYRELCSVEARVHGLSGGEEFALAKRPVNLESLSRESAAFVDRLDIPQD
ncbi:MAG TPA: hypothetical protein VNO31_16870 [Umezawaea sp.]|nr:hypothetical protein [Umezawaea sp.]